MDRSNQLPIDRYSRRFSWPVSVGGVSIGGDSPVKVQSMTSTSTMDKDGSVAQIERIVNAGGDIVRLTAQGVREAANLAQIKAELKIHGVDVPLVADIHFNPKAAFEAALHVDKVRINPGNFVDPGRTFKRLEYTDEEYAAEQQRIARTLVPFLELCRENQTAVRVGVNHGSLSDRIMSRYGDTPAGMVESAMEYLRIALDNNFKDIVISIKASNTVVMVETVRLLVKAMDAEKMHFPLHLGVTEAGDGDDGRIKSAVGIGSLLADGIGDTIRVSLSEEPECEIPVAQSLLKHVTEAGFLPDYLRGLVNQRTNIDEAIIAVTADGVSIDESYFVAQSNDVNQIGSIVAVIAEARANNERRPIIARLVYNGCSVDDVKLFAASDAGRLLLNNLVDGIWIESDSLSCSQLRRLELDILQAARCRFSKTEFISCPSCGRTLFDLQSTVKEVKASLSHLKGLKIAVMGCIVNGPGEMADADYGYVGAAAGKVSLYRGKECVVKNIERTEALGQMIELLKRDGKWQDA